VRDATDEEVGGEEEDGEPAEVGKVGGLGDDEDEWGARGQE
jgi:hypothetical protein